MNKVATSGVLVAGAVAGFALGALVPSGQATTAVVGKASAECVSKIGAGLLPGEKVASVSCVLVETLMNGKNVETWSCSASSGRAQANPKFAQPVAPAGDRPGLPGRAKAKRP